MNDAYTAGIIDGEGSITIVNASGYYYIRVNVTMSDKGYRVLEFLNREYGGKLEKERPAEGNRRASRMWRVSNAEAVSVIEAVYSFLKLKREQAFIALQLSDLIRDAEKHANGRTVWTDELKSRAEVFRLRMVELNARGTSIEPNAPEEGCLAVWKYGEWHEPHDDLFGPVAFGGSLPTSGRMVNGVIYPNTAGSECSSSPHELLRTPTAVEGEGGLVHPEKARRENRTVRLGAQILELLGVMTMPGVEAKTVDVESVDWGRYSGAVESWERETGRDVPFPAEKGTRGNWRLSAVFVEWMMGLEKGWVTDPEIGLSRNEQLRMLGNGVVPQQAVLALERICYEHV